MTIYQELLFLSGLLIPILAIISRLGYRFTKNPNYKGNLYYWRQHSLLYLMWFSYTMAYAVVAFVFLVGYINTLLS